MTTRKQAVIDDSANLVIDKVLEKRIAELIGTTPKALEHKRLSGFIPHGVWLKEGGRIMYSLERYNAWAENQWLSQMASRPGAIASGSGLLGTVSVEASRRRINRPPRGSQRQVVSVLV